MAYWMRVFCTDGAPRPLEEVFAWTAAQGQHLRLSESTPSAEDLSDSWSSVAIEYRDGKLPFLAEIRWVDDLEGGEEVHEFVELLAGTAESPERQRTLEHLERTRFVVANEIPTSDFDDHGFEAVDEFMRFFVEHNSGMIQADGEGFYEGDRLVVRLASDTESRSGIGFFEDDQFLPIPREGLLALADTLRARDEGSRDPVTDEEIDADEAELLADTIEIAVEQEGLVWTGSGSRPALRWAFLAWCETQPEPPSWALAAGDLLSLRPMVKASPAARIRRRRR
jgi:hypothetical protein